jgi:hypothetical protein
MPPSSQRCGTEHFLGGDYMGQVGLVEEDVRQFIFKRMYWA